MGWNALSIREDLNVFFLIERNRQGLSQFTPRGIITTDHIVEHIKGIIAGRRINCAQQTKISFPQTIAQVKSAAQVKLYGLVKRVGINSRPVIIALKKFIPFRDGLFFQHIDEFVDKRQPLAPVG